MVKVIEANLNPVVAEPDPGYGQLFAVLWRRRFWLVGVFGVVLAIAAVVTLRTKPVYESSMQLQVEPDYQGKKDLGATAGPESQFADSNVDIDYATQINVMRSSILLKKVVAMLRPEYSIKVDEIKKSLVLTQVQEDKANTKIVKAVYTANDPIKTQKVLKALRRVYADYNQQKQAQRLNKGLEFITAQLPQVENKVQESEANLENFRKSHNLIDPTQQATAIADSLAAIKKEQQTTAAQYRDAEARYSNLQQQLDRSPQKALIASRLSQSSRYQTLLNEFQKTELALAQKRLVFKDAASPVEVLQEQRQSQLKLLQNEVGRVLGGTDQPNATGERLLTEGQLNGIDLNLTSQLAEAQTNLLALNARSQSLAQIEQQQRQQLNQFPALIADYNSLQPKVQINRDTLEQLLKARQELRLEIARGGYDWQVLEEPELGVQTGPSLKRNLLLGAVMGLMLGSGAALLREMIDDAVHTSAELEKQSALPLLGMAPELPQTIDSEPPLISLPFGAPQVMAPWTIEIISWPPSWEALDLVYKNIQLLSSTSTFKSLMITSALAGEGKSTLALSLAISAARLHKRVLLIDADLRRPSLHKQLNLPNEQGLSTLLMSHDNVPNQSSIHSSGSYIDILTSGPIPTDPANLLSSQRMGELMAAFEQNYDLVILDAPPVLGMVDAILAGSFCNGVVLAARVGRVTRSELAQATAMLSKLNVIGVVANSASSTKGYSPYAKPQGSLSLRLHQPLLERGHTTD